MDKERDTYRNLVGKPERKSPLGRPMRGREGNTKMDLLEVGWGGIDWIAVAQDTGNWRAVVNTVMIFRVP
jgi:hypothetical protein